MINEWWMNETTRKAWAYTSVVIFISGTLVLVLAFFFTWASLVGCT